MLKKKYTLIDKVDNISSRLRPGRHLCSCQARIHKLIRNCLNCGRVVCEQEGSGPCFHCGMIVCTREERQILEKRDKKALELLRKLTSKPQLQNFEILDSGESNDEVLLIQQKLSLSSLAESIQKAQNYKQKLLVADKDQEVTKVNDLQADYFSLEMNPYLTSSEREAIVKRKEELRQIALQAKRNILVDLDMTSGKLAEQKKTEQIESVNDPVLQSILANSISKGLNKQQNKTNEEEEENGDLSSTFKPKYNGEMSKRKVQLEEVFASLSTNNYPLTYNSIKDENDFEGELFFNTLNDIAFDVK
ncbi:zf-C2HC5 domain-containing protein [Meloidogyne graminicola]|uniref:Zf-C2HC5 domain-containing protein n=1 Tax=Meloidogyne graminicola TaxID=189291 RepID=A0A8S9ZTW8_9BILA|nr:zf-C2HC5 domain-containing protein [Meloidogyne graminicola]